MVTEQDLKEMNFHRAYGHRFVRGEELQKWIAFLHSGTKIFDNGQEIKWDQWNPEKIEAGRMYELEQAD